MKYTPEKTLPLALLITFILIVTAGIFTLSGLNSYEESVNEFGTLSNQAKEIETLKARWDGAVSHNDLLYLQNHPNLSKEEKRGGSVYFEFNNLSSNEFDTLSNKLLNSMLVIKKLTLQRKDDAKGTLTVEVES